MIKFLREKESNDLNSLNKKKIVLIFKKLYRDGISQNWYGVRIKIMKILNQFKERE